jgi:hypothetical protein
MNMNSLHQQVLSLIFDRKSDVLPVSNVQVCGQLRRVYNDAHQSDVARRNESILPSFLDRIPIP